MTNTEDFTSRATAFANEIASAVGPRLRSFGQNAQARANVTAEIGIQVAAALSGEYADVEGLVAALKVYNSATTVRGNFEKKLHLLAKSDLRRIILPESDDDRVLRAAAIVLEQGVAKLTILGNSEVISRRAAELEIDLSGADIVDPTTPELLEKYAAEYAKLRAHKGVTIKQAKERMADLSYFGTMSVYFGEADGMVSGACHTTANTIRPALEFIKTKPSVSVVSGAFLMCLSDQVAVFSDCAVNINPSAEQLADIAITTSETAVSFGIVPKVAMLSYSTAFSGSGPDVDKVREATKIAQEKAPGLALDGPLQFDTSVSKDVAALKLPESLVAGQASVFIFPDLDAGNIGYKAVQRTSGALAIGPLLQGLRKPVNDLSRGALVDDIVNTIIITAIQAQTS